MPAPRSKVSDSPSPPAELRAITTLICRAFTLIELMVVIAIIVILVAVSIPAIKTLTTGTGQAQAVNLVRSYLANARSIAISQHREAGVVFFDDQSTYSSPVHQGQTGIQLFVQSFDQSSVPLTHPEVTIYEVYDKTVQYLPPNVMVATLNDASVKNSAGNFVSSFQLPTNGSATSGARCRAILFDASGQMILKNNMGVPDIGTGTAGTFPRMYGNWYFNTKSGNNHPGTSSPGCIVYDLSTYTNRLSATDADNYSWIQQHGDIIIINPYTGTAIR